MARNPTHIFAGQTNVAQELLERSRIRRNHSRRPIFALLRYIYRDRRSALRRFEANKSSVISRARGEQRTHLRLSQRNRGRLIGLGVWQTTRVGFQHTVLRRPFGGGCVSSRLTSGFPSRRDAGELHQAVARCFAAKAGPAAEDA